ncbi:immunoglobulin superfamily member 23 [Peromyscus maniculatus bairdii]|uniref:immunoglobulin superfamily member 23 n=1 Tax=Peromyscus maniculatus bairdii TaxID=230844 RepID=UPI001C2EA279|nr:immunoglobulin superfamily member 23 [Peromyscus maniculatus bairdii]
MNCLPNTGRGLVPAWKTLLLTGTLLTSCTCSAASKLAQMEGAGTYLPVPRTLDGVLSTSWSQEPEDRPPAMISPKGLLGLPHTSQDVVPHTEGSLVIRNVATQDTEVLDTSKPHGSSTEHIQVKYNPSLIPLVTFPVASKGVIYSDLNYSVILEWATRMNPEPVLSWTLNGKPCGTGEKLFIRRLSPEQLGTYLCIAKNSDKELVSEPVTVSLSQATEAPTVAAPTAAYPMKPDDFLSLSGGSAIGLLVAATLGGLVLLGAVCFYLVLALKK